MGTDRKQSLRKLAEACGYHYSTVSLALRNSPKLNAETRRKIQAFAMKEDFKVDPSASLLMSTFRQQRGFLSGFPVGMIGFHNPSMPHARKMHKALQQYADNNQLPFNFFDLSGTDLNQRQVARIATNRGLKGIIFGGSSERSRIDWDIWKHEPFAYLGYSQRTEDLIVDHVTWDVVSIIAMAVAELKKKQCRNFAVFLEDFINAGSGWHWSAACEIMRKQFVAEGDSQQKIRAFFKPDTSFKSWVTKNAPVGLIRIGTYVYPDFNLSNLFPGRDLGFSIEYPHSPHPDPFSVGQIEPDYRQIAETSFDTLCINMFFHRMGIPANPKRIYLNPVFKPHPA